MMNRIYFGDNLPILKSLPDESVDLIYIDPPFNTGKTQKHTRIKTVKSKNGSRKGFQGNTYETIEVSTKAYQDSFDFLDRDSVHSGLEKAYQTLASEGSLYYIETFLKPRLKEAYRLLKPHGSLYFHIDYREVHYCKILLDEIFGRESFLNEIIWAYDYGGRARSKWPAKHDNILFYVKDPKNYIFNVGAIDREPYMAPGLVGPEKAKKGKLPTDTWFPQFVGTKEGESDTWWLSYFNKGTNSALWQTIVPTGSKERVGYPTQKPRRLIDRIIKASSLPSNVVLDFFAGSGTVGESCLELERNFILIDNNKEALEVMAQRFSGEENIKWVNFDPAPYQIARKSSKKTKNEIPHLSSEFLMLAATASYIQKDLQEYSDLWKDSPFEWVLQLPARKKGKLGRQLISPWLASKGISVESTKDSSETLMIKGYRVATKFSTMWTKGFYRFQQIRSKGYDYVICLGISPLEAHCWIFPREYVIKYATQQHRGAKDYWIPLNPQNPPEWSRDWGGPLDEVYQIIKKLKPKTG
ncbi:MAG TPA: DNA methyltransferase [Anaerolineales bacterium]|nr:DNA methyltransferase [Anaerolineales bacterium]